jgi:hypothetical protein
MFYRISAFLLAGLVLFSTSCATIVSKSRYPVMVTSSPERANVVITNKKGITIYEGTTPVTMDLKAGSGFFSKARYQVTLSLDGYDTRTLPIEYKLDGWYFGNLLFGGLLGLLIIDPATGAMYKIDTPFIAATLQQSMTATETEEGSLKVYTLDDVPAEWREHLVRIAD